ncbi:hypothetical protein CEXT_173681 [Caerostris extrusa]|uniref:Uncharacterized protein n=1 Tax=Caerostris extrusa TaxID=172846 RepID=A0AAV4V1G6_CAEEX|nr:hypothetical protein CEXT_173681 [Caerostris extrusa]
MAGNVEMARKKKDKHPLDSKDFELGIPMKRFVIACTKVKFFYLFVFKRTPQFCILTLWFWYETSFIFPATHYQNYTSSITSPLFSAYQRPISINARLLKPLITLPSALVFGEGLLESQKAKTAFYSPHSRKRTRLTACSNKDPFSTAECAVHCLQRIIYSRQPFIMRHLSMLKKSVDTLYAIGPISE